MSRLSSHFTLLLTLLLPAGCVRTPADSAAPHPDSPSDSGTEDSMADSTAPDDTDTPEDSGDTGGDTGLTPEPWPDLAGDGPYPVEESTAWLNPSGICVTESTTFTPAGAPAAPHVILAHGFSRYQGVLADVARQWASWGLTVRTMTLCHIYALDNDPVQDAADLVSLSDDLGGGPVIYAGHSVGGMRAVLAGASDPDTVAVLGLDLVDFSDASWGDVYLGQQAAAGLAVPLYGVHGESTECNDYDVGLQVYAAAPQGMALRATEADHCDFEAPTDALCTMLCQGENVQFTDVEISATIRTLSTAFLLWQAGIEPRGEAWWTPDEEPYEALLGSGAVRVP